MGGLPQRVEDLLVEQLLSHQVEHEAKDLVAVSIFVEKFHDASVFKLLELDLDLVDVQVLQEVDCPQLFETEGAADDSRRLHEDDDRSRWSSHRALHCHV